MAFFVEKPAAPASASVINPPVMAACAKPRAKIDLVLPPIDFVPTNNASALIGSSFQFQVSFDNSLGNNPGYGPYLNVILPAGLSFNATPGATYVGSQIVANAYPVTSTSTHPFTNAPVSGAPGDQLVVIELPFGSYTPQQPPADVLVSVTLSSLVGVNQSLQIQVQAGFRYSCSGMGIGGALPGIPADDDYGTIQAALFTLEKKYDGEEIGPKTGETATGPNFPHRYAIVVNVAPGQTITNLKVTDTLPNNLAFKSLLPLQPSNGSVLGALPQVGIPVNNNTLTVIFPSVTGTGGTPTQPDVKVEFEFFIPDKDASGAWILDPQTGASAMSVNLATVEGTWGGALQTLDPVFYTLVCKSIALQKRGENTAQNDADVTHTLPPPPTDSGPNDKIRYVVDFQVSDYFTFNQLSVEDLISDGQFFLMFPALNTPTFKISDQLHSASANFPLTSVSSSGLPCTGFANGRTKVVFTLPGSMTGGLALSAPSNVPAVGSITFYARIQEDYMCPVPSGDFSVDQNDKLFDRATVTGTMLNNSTLESIGPMLDDDQVDFRLILGLPSKSVYAKTNRFNLTTILPPPTTLFAAGDKITFRYKYYLPHGDVEKLSLFDFLPLPILKTSAFSLAALPMCSGVVPAVNTACFQSGTLNLPGKPVVSAPPVNSLKFDYSTFDYPTWPVPVSARNIDVLFTLEVQPDPFVDGLTMMNQLMSQESNSFNEQTYQIATAKFKVAEPKLKIRKGAIATNNACGQFSQPSGQPLCVGSPFVRAQAPPGVTFSMNGVTGLINSTNLSTLMQSGLGNVDQGDLVTFALVIENEGSSPYGAFDVRIAETIPAGFVIPFGGPNLTVRNGAGTVLPYTGSAISFFAPPGIVLNDSLTAGSLAAKSPTNGQNIAVITYKLKLAPTVGTCAKLNNTGLIRNYASVAGGPNFADPVTGVTGQYSAIQSVTVGPRISKTLFSTNQIYTSGSNVTIGEAVTYKIRVNLPEGVTPALTVNDPLPAGLMALSVGPVTGPVTTPVPTIGMTLNACGAPVNVAFTAINVPINNNPNDNWFEFQLQARVCNVSSNIGTVGSQTVLNNSVVTGGAACQATSAAPVTVVEPKLVVTKQVSPATLVVGGQVQVALTVTNTGTSPAFNVVVDDPLLTAAFGPIFQVTTPSGWSFSTVSSGSNTIVRYQSAPLTNIPNGGSVTFVFRALAKACGTYVNTASVTDATTLLGVWPFERHYSAVSTPVNIVVNGPPCPCVPPPLNLANWWTFDEPLGSTMAFDKSKPPQFNNNGAYGSGNNAPTPTGGGIGNLLCFDGNDNVTVPSHPEVNFAGNCMIGPPTESFTIDFWIKMGGTSVAIPIIDKRTAGPVGYYVYTMNGRIFFQMNAAVFPTTSIAYNIGDNAPHFVAITVPRCTGMPATIYIDGVAVATFTPPPVNMVNGGNLVMGAQALGTGPGLRGCLDELEIFKRALSASEVQMIYAAGASGKCK